MKIVKTMVSTVLVLVTMNTQAALSISETNNQVLPKFERSVDCKVRNDIERNELPTTPNNMKLPEFGQGIIGWGTGPEGALAKLENLHLSDLDRYRKQGVDLKMLKEWQAFYENETNRNSCNPTAPIRAALMKKIIQLWN